MVYGLNLVIKIIDTISSGKYALFQRDGALFVVSEQGFGQVCYGLNTYPKTDLRFGEKQHMEIAESEDAIIEWVEEDYKRKPRIRHPDGLYLTPILFGPDHQAFTLEEMAKSAKDILAFQPDGKIRMASHDSGYRSHKYGYAADGMDVWLAAARSMDMEKYLSMMGDKETDMLDAIARLERLGENVTEHYQRGRVPDCLVITPNMIMSFPRQGQLNNTEKKDCWTKSTEMYEQPHSSNPSIMQYIGADTYAESPYALHLTLNSHHLSCQHIRGLKEQSSDHQLGINRDYAAIDKVMSAMSEWLTKLNALHNKVCAVNIDWRKDLRKSRNQDG